MTLAAQKPIAKIVLTAIRNRPLTSTGAEVAGLASDAAKLDPAYAAAAYIGSAALNTLQPRVIQLQADPNVTILVVEQTIHGKSHASIFRISTTHQLRASINGHVVEYFAPREIVITVPKRATAKIVITDAYAGQRIYREKQLSFRRPLTWGGIFSWVPGLHTETDVDLGTGKENVPSRAADLMMTHHYQIEALNGTTVAPWYGGDPPSQQVCESLPPKQYSAKVQQPGTNAQSPFDGQWCLRTRSGRYGLLAGAIYNNDPGIPFIDGLFAWKTWTFDYLLWKP